MTPPRGVLIDDVVRGVIEAWRQPPRPNFIWACWLGTIARSSEQRVCKRRSANQCVAAFANQPAPSRKKGYGQGNPKRRPFGLRLAAMPQSIRRRRLGKITGRAVRRALHAVLCRGVSASFRAPTSAAADCRLAMLGATRQEQSCQHRAASESTMSRALVCESIGGSSVVRTHVLLGWRRGLAPQPARANNFDSGGRSPSQGFRMWCWVVTRV